MSIISIIEIEKTEYVVKKDEKGNITLRVPLRQFEQSNGKIKTRAEDLIRKAESRMEKPFPAENGFPPERSKIRHLFSQVKASKR